MKQLKFYDFPPRLKDDAALRKIFNTFGSLIKLSVSVNTEDPSSTVSGICNFSSSEEAEAVFKGLNGLTIGNHVLKLELTQSNGETAKEEDEPRKAAVIVKPKGKVGRPPKAKNPLFAKQTPHKKDSSENEGKPESEKDVLLDDDRPKSRSSDIVKASKKKVLANDSDNESKAKSEASSSKPIAKKSKTNNEDKALPPVKRSKSNQSEGDQKAKMLKAETSTLSQVSNAGSKADSIQVKEAPALKNTLVRQDSEKSLLSKQQDKKETANRLSKAEELRLQKEEAKQKLEQAKAARLKAKRDTEAGLELFLKNAPTITGGLERKTSSGASVLASQTSKEKLSNTIAKKEAEISLGTSSKSVSDTLNGKDGEVERKSATNTTDTSEGDVWEEYIDETYGAPYYFNPKTQETVWELPTNSAKIIKMSEVTTNEANVNIDIIASSNAVASSRSEALPSVAKSESIPTSSVEIKEDSASKSMLVPKSSNESVKLPSAVHSKATDVSTNTLAKPSRFVNDIGPSSNNSVALDSLLGPTSKFPSLGATAERSAREPSMGRSASVGNAAIESIVRTEQPPDLTLVPPPLLTSGRQYPSIQTLTGSQLNALAEEPLKRTAASDRPDALARLDVPKPGPFIRQDSNSSQSHFRQGLTSPPPAVVENLVLVGEVINAKPTFGFIRAHDTTKTGTPQVYYHVDRCLDPVNLGDEVEFNVGWQSEKCQTYAFNVRKHRRGGYPPLNGPHVNAVPVSSVRSSVPIIRGGNVPQGPIPAPYVPFKRENVGPSTFVPSAYPPRNARSRDRYAADFHKTGVVHQPSSSTSRSRSRSPGSLRPRGPYPAEPVGYEKPVIRSYPPALPPQSQDRWGAEVSKPPYNPQYRRG